MLEMKNTLVLTTESRYCRKNISELEDAGFPCYPKVECSFETIVKLKWRK